MDSPLPPLLVAAGLKRIIASLLRQVATGVAKPQAIEFVESMSLKSKGTIKHAEVPEWAQMRTHSEDGFQRRLRPEEYLLLAVLEQAIADLKNGAPGVRVATDVWLTESPRPGLYFPFEQICEQFGLSASAVRKTVRMKPRGRKISASHSRSGRRRS